MRVCVVSFKECWQDEAGGWLSYGGFPVQMGAIASLFDEMTLVIVGVERRKGGILLPANAQVVPLRRPTGKDTRRKISVLAHLPYYLRMIAAHVRQTDVVYVPLPGDIPFLGMLVALVFRKRLIANYGGSWVRNSQTTLMNRVTKAWMRFFAVSKNIMLAVGEGEIPPARGIDWIFATALSRSELDRKSPVLDRGLSTPPRLAYVGRLSSEKGVAYLVEAVALLKGEGLGPIPTVTLIGDGPERKALEAKVRDLGCDAVMAFAGQLNRTELSRHLHQADFCVQPSLTEGLSAAWLDAMAHGLPVLASEVGAARGVVGSRGERGWLVPPGDARTLATTLSKVLTAPVDWPALRRRCRAYAEARTLEAWAREIGQICERRWNMLLEEGKLRA